MSAVEEAMYGNSQIGHKLHKTVRGFFVISGSAIGKSKERQLPAELLCDMLVVFYRWVLVVVPFHLNFERK